MERKLELKDICGYMPHVLNVEIHKNAIDMEDSDYNLLNNTGRIIEIEGIGGKIIDFLVKDAKDDCLYYTIEDIIPILRPLSDLYRTITHNGKEITPIVELAKISFPEYSWKTMQKFGAFAGSYRFDFYENIRCFDCSYKGRGVRVDYQVRLFDYLHKLKIDYRGLIDSGLAIDANTLEANPYNN
jgi:hypothetical protein